MEFFDKFKSQSGGELATVQAEQLNYPSTDRKFVVYLEGEISDRIQRSVRRRVVQL